MNETLPNYFTTRHSMGNLGFSATGCRFYYVNLDKDVYLG